MNVTTIRKPLLALLALLLIFAGIGVGSLTAKLVPQAAVSAGIAHAGTLAGNAQPPSYPQALASHTRVSSSMAASPLPTAITTCASPSTMPSLQATR